MGSPGYLEPGCVFTGKDNCRHGTENCRHQKTGSADLSKTMASLMRSWRGFVWNPVPHVPMSVVPGQLFGTIYQICWLFILIPEHYRKGRSYRHPDHSCCNLTPAGCRLTRSDRPFICTWYICPDQQKILSRLANRSGKELAVFRTISTIKTARKELQQAYINILCD